MNSLNLKIELSKPDGFVLSESGFSLGSHQNALIFMKQFKSLLSPLGISVDFEIDEAGQGLLLREQWFEHLRKTGKIQLTFSEALEALKQGNAIARRNWNGTGMFIYLNDGITSQPSSDPTYIDGIPPKFYSSGDNGIVTRHPCINMKVSSGATVTGWLASQVDLLAEDWYLVEMPF